MMWPKYWACVPFQSTLSVRRATQHVAQHVAQVIISIHALREESDGDMRIQRLRLHDFNPRSP